MDFSHTALWVTDYAETKKFYGEILGLKTTREMVDENGVYNLYLAGSNGSEIQFKFDPETERNLSTTAIDHIAFDTNKLESQFQSLKDEFDSIVVTEPRTRETRRGYQAKIALINDPTGYTVELVEWEEGSDDA